VLNRSTSVEGGAAKTVKLYLLRRAFAVLVFVGAGSEALGDTRADAAFAIVLRRDRIFIAGR
jgi:hypothetical protein